ncbi:permease-like cell division protein FtsX [Micromonospora ureilytica]|uniref:permease-like cell division protein FtsX n=1 Tax=Micromonospora ureilytica TaxID=709868 RepID=UPI000F5DE1CA|nr:permease-like cell division protein FtsX [Micromonospora ureilytica]WSG34782.1 permease-like cell division protein FtsX [Micromonospora ureilytica]
MRRGAPLLSLVVLLALPACTSQPEEPGDVALAVFLDNDVTVAQKGSVEQQLRSMPSVREVSLETREQAYERQKADLKDQPDLLAALKPEYMPELLHATVTDASIAEAVELVMAEADGVEDVALRIADVDPRPSRIGVIVRLESSATDQQRAAVEKAVRALPTAKSIEFEDRDAAYERLRERCQGKGDLSTQLRPQMTHESWRFEMPLNGEGSGVGDLMRLDGVDGVPLAPLAML